MMWHCDESQSDSFQIKVLGYVPLSGQIVKLSDSKYLLIDLLLCVRTLVCLFCSSDHDACSLCAAGLCGREADLLRVSVDPRG